MKDVPSFEDLPGCELGCVCFVMDYVEFRFHGPILRALADPVFIEGSRVVKFPEPGSHRTLCELIGRTVQSVEELPDRLMVSFQDGAQIEIPLASPVAGAEAANFHGAIDGSLAIGHSRYWDNLMPPRYPDVDPGSLSLSLGPSGRRKTVFETPASLEQEMLGSVCFAHDHVELCFSGPLLRSFAGPTAEAGGVKVRFPEAGSHELLCSFIGRAPDTVQTSTQSIVLRFGADSITIPLHPLPGQGPDAAHFIPQNNGKLLIDDTIIW